MISSKKTVIDLSLDRLPYNYFRLKPILISLIIWFVAFLPSLIVFIVFYIQWNLEQIVIAEIILFVASALLGIVCLSIAPRAGYQYRKKTADYDNKLPIKVQNEVMAIRSPALIAMFLCLISGLIFDLITKFF